MSSRLHELYTRQGQSPWLDNLQRPALRDGTVSHWIERGVRGMTSNPTTFQKAIAGSDAYDAQFRQLLGDGRSVEDAYWTMVVDDVTEALELFRPVHESSGGVDGYVSLELGPRLARDTAGSTAAAAAFHRRVNRPNLFVKIPGTAKGVPAVQRSLAAGHSINITLLFSVERYDQVIEAYLSALEAHEGDLAAVRSVASFFLSRVDSEVDARLEKIGSEEALALRGRAAVAQAKVAYDLFRRRFSGERWERLAARGATVQRPLWASTSAKNPAYADTVYVDSIIGPDTINTMPEETLEAFEDHGTLARTVDADLDEARDTIGHLARLGVDLEAVAERLEIEGVDKFAASFDDLMGSLGDKAKAIDAA